MKKFFAWALVASFTIVTLFWVASPYIIKPVVNSVLESYQLRLGDDSHIRFNPYELSVTASDISLWHKEVELLSLNQFQVDVEPSQFVFGNIVVKHVGLDGFTTQVTLEKDTLLVNGVDLLALFAVDDSSRKNNEENTEVASSENGTNDNEEASGQYGEKQTESTEKKALPDVFLDRLSVTNLTLTASKDTLSSTVKINDFSLLNVKVIEGVVSLRSRLKSVIEATMDDPVQPLSAQTHIHNQFNVTLNQTPHPVIQVDDFEFELTDTAAIAAGYQVGLNKLELGLDSLTLESPDSGPSIQADAEFLLSNLQVNVAGTQNKTVTLESLALPEIKLDSPQNAKATGPRVSIKSVELANLLAMIPSDEGTTVQENQESQKTQKKSQPLLVLEALDIKQITATSTSMAIEEILLGKIDVNALMSKDKQLSPLFLVQTTEQQSAPTSDEPTDDKGSDKEPNQVENQAETVEPEAKTDFAVRLDKFSLAEQIDVHFKDLSVSPEFESHIYLNTIELVGLDSNKPDDPAQFTLLGGMDEYTKIDVKAQLQPFSEKPVYAVDGSVKELSLPELSPYVSSALGYHIDSGQLNTQVQLNVLGTVLEGESLSLLKSVDLTAIDAEGEEATISGGAISFNVALGMLKDGDGVVELDVPITGDLNNPSVGLSGIMSLIVKQATMSAAKDYLITTFLPYAKVVKIAMSAGDQLLKMSFEPLVFTQGETAVSSEQYEYLGQLAGVLVEKPEINVKLCGIAVLNDITQGDTDALRQHAKKRADNVKRFLVKELGIASERLYSCAPTVDQESEAQARIEFEQL